MNEQEFIKNFKNKWWRLNNLYWIIDKQGKKVKFQCNFAQKKLFKQIHYNNIILKARQLGFTTFIDLWILDECLFHSNIEAGIVAHTKDDASAIFRRKIQFPYENLPGWLKEQRPLLVDNQSEYRFNNNSSISVGVSLRSGTFQLLHISEFGKVCARYPEKAREIVTGSLETVGLGQIIFIESTAEGSQGYFYDYCQAARKLQQSNTPLTKLDFRFHFFPWFENPEYRLPANFAYAKDFDDYFNRIEAMMLTDLDAEQRSWYVKKYLRLGEDMLREHPSTPDEAFQQSVKGAYFQNQLTQARREGRITKVPPEPGVPVHTLWDLGVNDTNAIWFVQVVGRELRAIDYYENSGEGLPHYMAVLDQKREERGFRYGKHLAPHDIQVREWSTGESRLTTAQRLGLRFDCVPRVEKKMDSIEAARQLIGITWFDEEHCSLGIERLENYRKEWDQVRNCYKNRPLHDENSNGADAFQTGAWGRQLLFEDHVVEARPIMAGVTVVGWT